MNALQTTPMWLSDLSEADRRRIDANARRLRAKAAHDVLTGIGRWIGNAVAEWRANRRRAAAVAELRGLDAGTLKDIGIDRSAIVSVVHGLDAADRAPAPIAATTDGANVVAFTDKPRRRPAKRPAPTFGARVIDRRAVACG